MAVAFDSVGPSSAGASTTTALTLTWTHTVVASSGVAIVASVAFGASSTTQNAETISVTCGGTAMTSLGKVQSNNSNVGYEQLFGITGQTSGAKTITVTVGGGSAIPASMTGGSLGFTGAASFGTAVTAFGSSTTPSVTVTGTGTANMMVCGVAGGSAISGAGTGVTSRWLKNTATTSGAGEGAEGTAASVASGSVTMTWTMTTDFWGIIGLEVIAAATAAAPPRPALVVRQAVARSYTY